MEIKLSNFLQHIIDVYLQVNKFWVISRIGKVLLIFFKIEMLLPFSII